MGHYEDIDREIAKLDSMIPSSWSPANKPNWKAIWNQIRWIHSLFKGARYPTHEQRQKSWDNLKRLEGKAKRLKAEEQKFWENKKRESARLRDRIITQARNAKPPSEFADLVLAMVTGGLSCVLDSIMGPFDEMKRDLEFANQQLKKGWKMLSENKGIMLASDKQDAFEALKKAKDNLDEKWKEYKDKRGRAFKEYLRQKEEREIARQRKIENNIRKNLERLGKLKAARSRKITNIDNLHDKLSRAWSDDYISRISNWISEEEDKLQDIINKISKIEGWIEEDRAKLR